MQALGTSDYRGYQWPSQHEDEEEGYPLYVFLFAYSVASGTDRRDPARSL